jgi:hypothetical protein
MLRFLARYGTGWRCLAAGAVGFAVPKCLLCLAGYTALATSVGWAGPELCGDVRPDRLPVVLGAIIAAGAVAAVYDRRLRKRRRSWIALPRSKD